MESSSNKRYYIASCNIFKETKSQESYVFNQDTFTSLKPYFSF